MLISTCESSRRNGNVMVALGGPGETFPRYYIVPQRYSVHCSKL